MKLENVLENLPMFMPKNFMDEFIFIWGCEQCSKTIGEISPKSRCYFKDLKDVYYGCHGLLYGKENQTLFIDDKLHRTL
jgi:hypothetical protein